MPGSHSPHPRPAADSPLPRPDPPSLQAAEGKAYSGYDYAKDTTASGYDSALRSAYDNWQASRALGACAALCCAGMCCAGLFGGLTLWL